MELESDIERRFCRGLDELELEHIKLNLRGNRGWPDRLIFIPGGRPFLVELKRLGEEPTGLQKHRHRTLRRLGYDVEVHDDSDEALAAVVHRVRRAKDDHSKAPMRPMLPARASTSSMRVRVRGADTRSEVRVRSQRADVVSGRAASARVDERRKQAAGSRKRGVVQKGARATRAPRRR